ncbi:hypothetical protein [Nocardiopsis composta]|uniref:ABC-type antimicrobial peptide transport system permease subunit n=1 Tax=Nocardiopsis composta TaxID=157465 RepID=A0A7W8QR34_9ACTN|nr:hypothetical protein [Nocardiopsis composta]MBB5434594.1 ABC-type antimicrobial peptide transport system permease subunit [Nocardiopsis composta]
MAVRAVSGAVIGIALGFFLTVIAVVSTIAISFVTETTVSIPYVIESSFKEVEGLPELYFTPNFLGMLGVIIAFGVMVMGYSMAAGHRRETAR